MNGTIDDKTAARGGGARRGLTTRYGVVRDVSYDMVGVVVTCRRPCPRDFMLLAYTISNIYQRHRLRTKKAKLDDSEVVGHDETLLFIVVAIYAIAVLARPRIHTTMTRLNSSAVSFNTNEKHVFPSIEP